ncbi:purine and uridine phosphorylase [Penicillium chermesinum]|nr:purine and uridine phosphorylase [Penicillium chermesinum]
MNEHHSGSDQWMCHICTQKNIYASFTISDDFVEHLEHQHSEGIEPRQIPMLILAWRRKAPPKFTSCPLCTFAGEEEKAVLDHIAEHIHSFSLRSLPWAPAEGSSEPEGKNVKYGAYFDEHPYFEVHSCVSDKSPSSTGVAPLATQFSDFELESDAEGQANSRPNEGKNLSNDHVYQIADNNSISSDLTHWLERLEGDLNQYQRSLFSTSDYNIAWICPTRLVYTAARTFLDQAQDPSGHLVSLNTAFHTLGSIGKRRILIATCRDQEYDEVGSPLSSDVISDVLLHYDNICIFMIIGLGSGLPTPKNDIRLGDIVVAVGPEEHLDFATPMPQSETQAGLQLIGGWLNDSHVEHLDDNTRLRTDLMDLSRSYNHEGCPLGNMVNQVLANRPRMRRRYGRPDPVTDRLHKSDTQHPQEIEKSTSLDMADQNTSSLVSPPERTGDNDKPSIHFGTIASSRDIIKSTTVRDKLASERGILCIETEHTEVPHYTPCLSIRGICDYADSHKTKDWQGYAAMVACAYAKEALSCDTISAIVASGTKSQRFSSVPSRGWGTPIDQDAHKYSIYSK